DEGRAPPGPSIRQRRGGGASGPLFFFVQKPPQLRDFAFSQELWVSLSRGGKFGGLAGGEALGEIFVQAQGLHSPFRMARPEPLFQDRHRSRLVTCKPPSKAMPRGQRQE